VFNSIVAGNSGAAGFARDFNGIAYASGSLFQDTTFLTITQAPGPQNITGQDPQLGALQNNGGPTPTRRLAPTSPVIDKGFSYLGADQRGVGRPIDIGTVSNAANGDGSDIGAVELTAAEATIPPAAQPPVTPTKKKKCKKKKKHSAAVELRRTGGKDWPGSAFKSSPRGHARND